MNFIRHVLKNMLMLTFIVFFIKGTEQPTNSRPFSAEEIQALEQKKKYLDLMILLDPEEEENSSAPRVNSFTLATALSQKSCPIMTSVNIVQNCCFWLQQHKELFDNVKKAIITDYTTAFEKSKTLCGPVFDPKTALVLSLIDFNDWDCFIHENSNFILLIPKSYISRHTTTNMTYDDKIKECGFNTAQLKKINEPSPKIISETISSAQRTDNFYHVTPSVMSMFIPQKKLFLEGKIEKSQPMQVWNIVIIGHGSSATVGASGSEAGYVAGVPFPLFEKILNFLENSVNTSFLHYRTCFGGGQNQTLVNDTLSKIAVSFIVSGEGVTERSVYARNLLTVPASKENSTFIMSSMNFLNFFNLLNAFFGDTSAFMSMQAVGKQLQKDPIATILRNIVQFDYAEINQPAIRIPSVGTFNAVSVDKSVKILTNSIAKAYEFEGKAIDYLAPEIKAIILYPAYIGVALNMKPGIRIVSPTQQKNVKAQKTVHILKEVACKASLPAVLSSFILANENLYKIVFSIEKLECLDYQDSGLEGGKDQPLMLKNMVVVIKGITEPKIDIAFVHKDKKYSYSFKIDPDTNAQSRQTATFLTGLLAYSELMPSNSTNNYDIIAQEVGVVDTSLSVQQPGSLKKILFVQKLDGLEKALAPEQIAQEKAWLAKNNKSVATFANTLNRYKTELSELIEQINKIPVKDLNQKDRDQLLQKAEIIKGRIDKELVLLQSIQPVQPSKSGKQDKSIKPAKQVKQSVRSVKQPAQVVKMSARRKRIASGSA